MEDKNNKYTGRQIAIFTDLHGLLYPTIAILDDIKKRGITEVYSLGDNIGVGPNPREVLDLLGEHDVKTVNGNSEEYSAIGVEPFRSYIHPGSLKEASQDWTYSQLSPEQIEQLQNNPHSYDLTVGGMKIGLCHFGNDVRIDFGHRSTWSYQKSINYGWGNPQEQFYYTNSDRQKEIVEARAKILTPENEGFRSAQKDPLFGGKTIDTYDEVFQGHVHFDLLTEDEKVKIRTLRAAAMGFGPGQDVDYASYIIIREKEIGYDVEEVLVQFDKAKMDKSIRDSDMPDKDRVTAFTSKRR